MRLPFRRPRTHLWKCPWIDDILPLVEDSTDPLGVLDLTTHSLPLGDAPNGYETFQDKADVCVKVVLKP